jgi:curved DNA-binding protein CbpA
VAHDESYYDVLGVQPGASAEAIRAAYVKLALEFHPDRHQGNPLEALAKQRLVLINQAYQALSDPQRRARYDADRRVSPAGNSPRTVFSPQGIKALLLTLLLIAALPLLVRFGLPLLRLLWRLVRAVLSIL